MKTKKYIKKNIKGGSENKSVHNIYQKIQKHKIIPYQGCTPYFDPDTDFVDEKNKIYTIKYEYDGMVLLKKISEKFNKEYPEKPYIYIPVISDLIELNHSPEIDLKEYDLTEFNSNKLSEFKPTEIYKYQQENNRSIGYFLEYIPDLSNISTNYIKNKDSIQNIDIYVEKLENFIKFCHKYNFYHGDLDNNIYFDNINKRIIIIDPWNIDCRDEYKGNQLNRRNINHKEKNISHIQFKNINIKAKNMNSLNIIKKKITKMKEDILAKAELKKDLATSSIPLPSQESHSGISPSPRKNSMEFTARIPRSKRKNIEFKKKLQEKEKKTRKNDNNQIFKKLFAKYKK